MPNFFFNDDDEVAAADDDFRCFFPGPADPFAPAAARFPLPAALEDPRPLLPVDFSAAAPLPLVFFFFFFLNFCYSFFSCFDHIIKALLQRGKLYPKKI